jgi:hypothetical protein
MKYAFVRIEGQEGIRLDIKSGEDVIESDGDQIENEVEEHAV